MFLFSTESASQQLKKMHCFFIPSNRKPKRLVFDFTQAPCMNSSHSKANNHARFKQQWGKYW